jgi:hypothetical protein
MTPPLNAANGFEPSVRIVAHYHGEKADVMRDTLLSPQLDVAKVDVSGEVFDITCRTRAAAILLIQMFPSLSLSFEQFHVESPASPMASAGTDTPPALEAAME